MKTLIFALLSVTFVTQVSAQVPTQTEALRNGVFRYFRNLPRQGASYLMHSLNMGQYDFFRQLHRDYENSRRHNTPFDVFAANTSKRLPTTENAYPFLNNGADFADVIQLEFGVCAGMSLTIRRFNMLAYFDSTMEYEEAPSKDSPQWFRFYKEKIDQILSQKKPAIIPGYNNLLELSSEPEIQTYIKQHVVREWADSASALWRGVAQQLYSVTGNFSQREANKLHEELSYKTLQLGYSPIVWLAKPNSNPFDREQWIHVMQVVEVSPKAADGGYTVKVWDVNKPAPMATEMEIEINGAGEARFGGDLLAEVEVLHFDDFEVAEMISNKLDWCADRPGLCTGRN